MRFLVDECTGPAVARWLRDQQHTVFSVYEEARGIADDYVIQKAYDENWILITNDKGFGEKIYRERRSHRGVIFLRLDDERAPRRSGFCPDCLNFMPTVCPTDLSFSPRREFALRGLSHAAKAH